MPLNFPSNPANNQTYSFGNQTWYWANNVGYWQANNSTSTVVISDTTPASPQPGNMWWNSNLGGLYIYYSDGTSSQWVEASPRKPPTSSPFGYSIIFGGF